ncbi:hypothetical protein K502DRAFT_366968 [Neoconidiobolus thromboides FSU 785]|nr:hypothetical protein K502DRAFT_366968 [Neoconidiobolus thromboides FSU 785]
MNQYFQRQNLRNPYFNTKNWLNSDESSSEETTSDSEEETSFNSRKKQAKIILQLKLKQQQILIAERQEEFIKKNGLKKRIIHRKIIILWENIINCWTSSEGIIGWNNLYQSFLYISNWIKKCPLITFSGPLKPALIRLLLNLQIISCKDRVGMEDDSNNSKEAKIIQQLNQEVDEIIKREKESIKFYKSIKLPFDKLNNTFWLRIEEYLLVSPNYVLNLSNMGLKKLMCEMYDFELILQYYSKFDTLNINLYDIKNVQYINLSFNKLKDIPDPYFSLTKFSGLLGLFLDGNKIKTISPSLLSSKNLQLITGCDKTNRNFLSFEKKVNFLKKIDPKAIKTYPLTLFELAINKITYSQLNEVKKYMSPRLVKLMKNSGHCEVCKRVVVNKEDNNLSTYSQYLDAKVFIDYSEFSFCSLKTSNQLNCNNISLVYLPLLRRFCLTCYYYHIFNSYGFKLKACRCLTCKKAKAFSTLKEL